MYSVRSLEIQFSLRLQQKPTIRLMGQRDWISLSVGRKILQLGQCLRDFLSNLLNVLTVLNAALGIRSTFVQCPGFKLQVNTRRRPDVLNQ